ncbi:F0F1 ATP synthase subunit B [Mycoplasmoides alvi]|uniref:F0F1 ATP synthase subunit B n=1 Tax=Mycoplasmoides alvi TaxID=78580 RepID=UPI000698D0CC|nr:F0F1 ATP synthase subunit B [Mycoplasmoides alvi]
MNILRRSKKYFLLLSILVLIFIFSLTLTSCALPEELNQDTIVNQFFPNFWVFLANIIALILLLVVMIWFLWKPTKRTLANRSEIIQKNIDEANNARKEAELYLLQANEKRMKAISEAQKIVNNSTNEAYQIKNEIETKARRDANVILQNARNELTKQENRLRSQLNEEIIELTIAATTELTKKSISNEDNKKFIETFISELEEIDFE